MAKYIFNENGVCINPKVVTLYSNVSDKCHAQAEFAQVNQGWVYGTTFYMTLNIVEAYGLQSDCPWIDAKPMTYEECMTLAIKEAIEFYSEKGRKERCTKCLAHLHKLLNNQK